MVNSYLGDQLSQFAWDCPGFSTESLMSWELPVPANMTVGHQNSQAQSMQSAELAHSRHFILWLPLQMVVLIERGKAEVEWDHRGRPNPTDRT